MNIYTLEIFIISGPVDTKFVKKNPVLSRTVMIRGDQTLAQLHKIIFKALDRFDEHLYEFQIGGKVPKTPRPEGTDFLCIRTKYPMTLSWQGM